jgi:hypothetical protein
MKTVWLSILTGIFLSFYSIAFPQSYSGIFYDFYFLRQPSPRMESMGGGTAANNLNEFAMSYNPALTSMGEGLNAYYSYSDKIYYRSNSKYNNAGATYNLKKSGSIGVSFNSMYFSTGYVTDVMYETTTLYTVNYSREILNDFYAGINLSIFLPSRPVSKKTAYPIDIGLLKKFVIKNRGKSSTAHSVMLGSSLRNVSKARIHFYDDYYYTLPQIFRLGAGYSFSFNGNLLIKNSKTINAFIHLDYENVLNAYNMNAYRAGMEIELLEILSLRGGYCEGNGIIADKNRFTYGAGIKLALSRYIEQKNNFTLFLDYASMKQNAHDFYGNLRNFQTIAVRVNCIP